MRDFSEYEKIIIKRIVSECDKEGYSISVDIIVQELEKIGIIATEWDETYTYAKFYGINDHKTYTKVFDIILLFKYLEENRYILSHLREVTYFDLYSIKRFVKRNGFYQRINSDGTEEATNNDFATIHTNIGKEIEQYSKLMIYASHTLIDLVRNDFKTPEQREFYKQLTEAKKQTGYSRGALYASLVALILSLISTIFTTCKDTRIDSNQFYQIKQSIDKLPHPKEVKTETIIYDFKEK